MFKGGNNFETILSQPCYSHLPPDGKGELGGVQRWTQLLIALQENVVVCRQIERGGRRCSKVDTTEQTNFFPQQSEHGGDRQKLI